MFMFTYWFTMILRENVHQHFAVGELFLFAYNRDSKYCLTSGIVGSVTLVKQCLKMWLFSWILLKIIIHLLCAKSASLQNEEQNKTQFGSKEITRQQIFKAVNILGDSDVLTGSAIIIFSSSVLPRSSLERRQMGKTLLSWLLLQKEVELWPVKHGLSTYASEREALVY